MEALRAMFVMEQTLGHTTHARNLRDALAEQSNIRPTWLPIGFGAHGATRFVPLLRNNWSVRASWRARRALDKAMAAAPHDALLFHTQVTALFSTDLMRRMPTIVSLDATPENFDAVGRAYGHRPAAGSFIDRQKHRLNRRMFESTAHLVAWSEWTRRSLIDDYNIDPEKISVLAPGAAGAYFEVGARRVPQPTFVDRPVRVLFVGGDFVRKGGPLLLECMRGTLGDRCELHVVTKDAVAPQPNVHVHQNIGPNSPELLRLFAAADVFVLPSQAECLAVVLMEAAAAGLPVITTDVGALREAVLPGESGLLIPAGDISALHESLELLTGDAGLRRRMGCAGHALALRKFDARANNRALLDLLLEVAGSRHVSQPARRIAC
jgi:glycosyltransferase involved in cell wall biosynthesis